MDYVSKILWHFIRSSPTESSLDIFLQKILNPAGNELNLKKDPRNAGPYPRSTYIKSRDAKISTDFISGGLAQDLPETPKDIFEPRSVCFADIPFNFLPIHLQRYNGIGIGIDVESLKAQYSQLRPAWYIPQLFSEDIVELFQNPDENLLKDYVKVGAIGDEEFQLIYREREWKVPTDVKISTDKLTALVVQTEEEKDKILKDARITELVKKGVSLISFHEFFFEHGGRQ